MGSHSMMHIFCKYKAYLKTAKGSAGLWSLTEDCSDSIACDLGITRESENLPKQTDSESTSVFACVACVQVEECGPTNADNVSTLESFSSVIVRFCLLVLRLSLLLPWNLQMR